MRSGETPAPAPPAPQGHMQREVVLPPVLSVPLPAVEVSPPSPATADDLNTVCTPAPATTSAPTSAAFNSSPRSTRDLATSDALASLQRIRGALQGTTNGRVCGLRVRLPPAALSPSQRERQRRRRRQQLQQQAEQQYASSPDAGEPRLPQGSEHLCETFSTSSTAREAAEAQILRTNLATDADERESEGVGVLMSPFFSSSSPGSGGPPCFSPPKPRFRPTGQRCNKPRPTRAAQLRAQAGRNTRVGFAAAEAKERAAMVKPPKEPPTDPGAASLAKAAPVVVTGGRSGGGGETEDAAEIVEDLHPLASMTKSQLMDLPPPPPPDGPPPSLPANFRAKKTAKQRSSARTTAAVTPATRPVNTVQAARTTPSGDQTVAADTATATVGSADSSVAARQPGHQAASATSVIADASSATAATAPGAAAAAIDAEADTATAEEDADDAIDAADLLAEALTNDEGPARVPPLMTWQMNGTLSAIARHEFEASTQNEMSLAKGERVNIKVVDAHGHWWYVTAAPKKGLKASKAAKAAQALGVSEHENVNQSADTKASGDVGVDARAAVEFPPAYPGRGAKQDSDRHSDGRSGYVPSTYLAIDRFPSPRRLAYAKAHQKNAEFAAMQKAAIDKALHTLPLDDIIDGGDGDDDDGGDDIYDVGDDDDAAAQGGQRRRRHRRRKPRGRAKKKGKAKHSRRAHRAKSKKHGTACGSGTGDDASKPPVPPRPKITKSRAHNKRKRQRAAAHAANHRDLGAQAASPATPGPLACCYRSKVPPADPSLRPSAWTEWLPAIDPRTRLPYFYDLRTRVTQWARPTAKSHPKGGGGRRCGGGHKVVSASKAMQPSDAAVPEQAEDEDSDAEKNQKKDNDKGKGTQLQQSADEMLELDPMEKFMAEAQAKMAKVQKEAHKKNEAIVRHEKRAAARRSSMSTLALVKAGIDDDDGRTKPLCGKQIPRAPPQSKSGSTLFDIFPSAELRDPRPAGRYRGQTPGSRVTVTEADAKRNGPAPLQMLEAIQRDMALSGRGAVTPVAGQLSPELQPPPLPVADYAVAVHAPYM